MIIKIKWLYLLSLYQSLDFYKDVIDMSLIKINKEHGRDKIIRVNATIGEGNVLGDVSLKVTSIEINYHNLCTSNLSAGETATLICEEIRRLMESEAMDDLHALMSFDKIIEVTMIREEE